jgi:predicted metal-dependent hydrolase
MTMIPRNMRIDFTDAPLFWSKNRAYATATNAGSPGATAFEPYLNKVMAWARNALDGTNPELARDIDLFIAQEGHHYRVHKAFNKLLYERYPRAREFEEELAETLRNQFDTKPLDYNLAYCAGFENFACYMAKFIYARALPWYRGAENRMATLWLWHLAEEFEHRAACSDALDAISGNYFVRIRGLILFMRMVLPWQKRLVGYMLEVDRATMTPDERVESIWTKRRHDRALARYVFPRMLQIFLPFYDPRGQRAPRVLDHALRHFEEVASQRRRLTA